MKEEGRLTTALRFREETPNKGHSNRLLHCTNTSERNLFQAIKRPYGAAFPYMPFSRSTYSSRSLRRLDPHHQIAGRPAPLVGLAFPAVFPPRSRVVRLGDLGEERCAIDGHALSMVSGLPGAASPSIPTAQSAATSTLYEGQSP